MIETKPEEKQREELRRMIAGDFGKETVDTDLESLLALIMFETIRSSHPVLNFDSAKKEEMVVAMFPKVPQLRGKYTARLNGDKLKIFRAGNEEPIAAYAHPLVKFTYDKIMNNFYPEEK